MAALTPIRRRTRGERLRELAVDGLLVAALIYGLPLLAGLVMLLIRLVSA